MHCVAKMWVDPKSVKNIYSLLRELGGNFRNVFCVYCLFTGKGGSSELSRGSDCSLVSVGAWLLNQ